MITSDRNSHVTTHISRLKKAQSILEYVIVLTAIVAAVIAGASFVKNKVNEAIGTDVAQTIDTATQKIANIAP
ncbi:MAG: hypothetical protein ACE5GG_00375 [Candidatus Omnitrophota bacterium]